VVGDTAGFEGGTGLAEVTSIGGPVLPAQQAVRKATEIARNRLRFIRFTRKTIGFSKENYWMARQPHLSLGYCHFCRAHAGLRQEIIPPLPTKGSGSPKKWRQVTPAMASGITITSGPWKNS
jgi:hypothetical protein